MSNTHRDQILSHLQSGHTISPLQALNQFGCLRLGARIWDLRQEGYSIERTLQSSATGKKHWAVYRLVAGKAVSHETANCETKAVADLAGAV